MEWNVMVSCKHVSDHADPLLDGELGLWESLKLRLHLALCVGCRRFVKQLRKTRDLIRYSTRTEAEDPPEAMVDQLFARAGVPGEDPRS
ncbi:MAG: zf-HC2 domain-containing protein [Paracoccaceae bacterium]|nr:zf-HC2 domain-containing protein [Paracoccaceae bacterium]